MYIICSMPKTTYGHTVQPTGDAPYTVYITINLCSLNVPWACLTILSASMDSLPVYGNLLCAKVS